VIADIALVVARRFRVPVVVISQDVFPEIAVALKRLESPLLIGLLRVFVRFYLSRNSSHLCSETNKQLIPSESTVIVLIECFESLSKLPHFFLCNHMCCQERQCGLL
jgi:hypothetical protein